MKFKKSDINISASVDISFRKDGFEAGHFEIPALNKSQSGVYCIRNKFNNKLYIGMARNLENRMKRHWNDLLKGIHCSKLMQAEFDDYFSAFNAVCKDDIAEMFEFEVIIYCRPSELTFYENILINNLHPEYNTKKVKE